MNKLLRSIGLFSLFALCLILLKFLGVVLGAATVGSAVYVLYVVREHIIYKESSKDE